MRPENAQDETLKYFWTTRLKLAVRLLAKCCKLFEGDLWNLSSFITITKAMTGKDITSSGSAAATGCLMAFLCSR